jgi:hypothetical protein
MGDSVAEAQISDLSGTELNVFLEIYETLQIVPGNGRQLGPPGNMFVYAKTQLRLDTAAPTIGGR